MADEDDQRYPPPGVGAPGQFDHHQAVRFLRAGSLPLGFPVHLAQTCPQVGGGHQASQRVLTDGNGHAGEPRVGPAFGERGHHVQRGRPLTEYQVQRGDVGHCLGDPDARLRAGPAEQGAGLAAGFRPRYAARATPSTAAVHQSLSERRPADRLCRRHAARSLRRSARLRSRSRFPPATFAASGTLVRRMPSDPAWMCLRPSASPVQTANLLRYDAGLHKDFW